MSGVLARAMSRVLVLTVVGALALTAVVAEETSTAAPASAAAHVAEVDDFCRPDGPKPDHSDDEVDTGGDDGSDGSGDGEVPGGLVEELVACGGGATPKPIIKKPDSKVHAGQVLKPDLSRFKSDPVFSSAKFSYRWRLDGVVVSKDKHYTVRTEDVGKKIQLGVIPKHELFPSEKPIWSKAVTVAVMPFERVGKPKISGTPKIGVTLTAKVGDWSPSKGNSYAYQWYRDGAAIEGATKSTYRLKEVDRGAEIRVKVTASRPGYATKTVSSAVLKTPIRPGTPIIKGIPGIGSELVASVGDWKPKPKYSYQWYRGTTPIPGATSSKYRLVEADAGRSIRVEVTGTKSGWPRAWAKSAAVKAGVITVGKVQISGTARQGAKLSARLSGWSAPSGLTFRYQWLRDGVPISKATGSSYTLKKADADARISVRVTASKSGFTTVTKESGWVGFLGAGSVEIVAKPDGKLVVGIKNWATHQQHYTLKYQWYSDGSLIPGQMSSLGWYPGPQYVGKVLTVKATAEKDGFTAATAASAGYRVPG